MKKIMSLKEGEGFVDEMFDVVLFLTESISRFDSIYPANSTSFIRFELMKRVVNELVVLAVGIRSTAVVDDGENGFILNTIVHFPKMTTRRILLDVRRWCWLWPKTLESLIK